MNNLSPLEFLNTIYLGDRSIKKVIIDGWNEEVKIQIDVISMIQKGHETWDYYSDGDIEDGLLAFKGVKSIKILPSGAIADDYIVSFKIERCCNDSLYLANISAGGYESGGHRCEVAFEIIFSAISIERPT